MKIVKLPIPEDGKPEKCPKGHECYVRTFLDTDPPKREHYDDLVPNRYCALCGRRWLQEEP